MDGYAPVFPRCQCFIEDSHLAKLGALRFFRKVQILYQAGQIRIDSRESNGGAVTSTYVTDSETEKSLEIQRKVAVIRSQSLAPFPHGVNYQSAYYTFTGCVPISRCFRSRSNVRCWTESGLVVLESDPDRKSDILPASGIKVVFDPDRGLMPKSIEAYRLVDGVRVTERKTQVAQYAVVNDVNVPTQAATTHFDTAVGSTFGERVGVETMAVDLTRSHWNLRIPEDRFLLAIPSGTTVSDNTRGIRFIAGHNDPGKNIDALVTNAKNVIEYRLPSSVQNSQRRIWWWLGAAALSSALVWIWYRRRAGY